MGRIIIPTPSSRVFLTGPIQCFSGQGIVGSQAEFNWPDTVDPAATVLHCVAQVVRIPLNNTGYSDASLCISMPSDLTSAYMSIGMSCDLLGSGALGFTEPNGLARFPVPSDPVQPRTFFWQFLGTVTQNGQWGGAFGVNWTLCIEGWDLP